MSLDAWLALHWRVFNGFSTCDDNNCPDTISSENEYEISQWFESFTKRQSALVGVQLTIRTHWIRRILVNFKEKRKSLVKVCLKLKGTSTLELPCLMRFLPLQLAFDSSRFTIKLLIRTLHFVFSSSTPAQLSQPPCYLIQFKHWINELNKTTFGVNKDEGVGSWKGKKNTRVRNYKPLSRRKWSAFCRRQENTA